MATKETTQRLNTEVGGSTPAWSAPLKRTRTAAWAALTWERLWPLLAPFIGALAAFAIVSWFGFWPMMADWLRYALLALFAAGTAASLLPLRKFALPSSAELDTRIERATHLAHRPVTAQSDRPVGVGASSAQKSGGGFADILWREHQKRASESLKHLNPGRPVPDIARRDPFALRAVVVLALVVAGGVGWGQWQTRLGDAFRTHTTIAAATGRLDAWVTPPVYTNRPPIFLNDVQVADADIIVPEGSEVVVRLFDLPGASLSIMSDDQSRTINPDTPDAEKTAAKSTDPDGATPVPNGASAADTSKTLSFTTKLEQTASVQLRLNGAVARTWGFTVLPDEDPSIAFEDRPAGSNRGALEFSYSVKDDYGIVSAKADLTATQAAQPGADPLIEAPELPLPLPRRRAKEGTSKTSRDLTSHPWAGAEVTLTLIVEDEAGQKGKSAAETFRLPERVFTKPLALAIVDERRRLALDANKARDVANMLNVITSTHPDQFINDAAVYTGLRVAYRTLRRSNKKEELRDTVDLLWEIALSVEDGDLSLAERRLRDAQERLSEALE
ncbi:MAG: TIGR02302 family protein, partial [Pseudomonadota bacterium]